MFEMLNGAIGYFWEKGSSYEFEFLCLCRNMEIKLFLFLFIIISIILAKNRQKYQHFLVNKPMINLQIFNQRGYYCHIAIQITLIILLIMNQSFDASSNNYHLPRIAQNQSTYLRSNSKNSADMRRSASYSQAAKNNKVNLTRKLVMMEDIKNAEQYQNMNEKQLLREHEKLLKVLKKFQQIIDINLQKKQKQREKNGANKPQASKQQIFHGEIANNKKIIDNYTKQLKELEALKKCRKLHEVIEEKSKVQADINRLKKEIFNLKNEDNMAGRSLVADRGIIQKQLKQHEKDLKIELIKKQQYQQKIESLQAHLAQLKKQCEGLNVNQITNQKSHNEAIATKIAQKKQQLQQVTKLYVNYQENIQENMVAKAKRNKNIAKEIQNYQRRIVELNHKIQGYKQKVARYQQAMEIGPNKDKKDNP